MRKIEDMGLQREQALADGVADVASELRLIDVVDFAAFFRTERYSNISDLVNTAAERYFKANSLRFGEAGEAILSWDAPPAIIFDMEFNHAGVRAYFRLFLEAALAGVELTYITFDEPADDPGNNTRRLIAAIADARLLPQRMARAG